jgi:hypothetical protein
VEKKSAVAVFEVVGDSVEGTLTVVLFVFVGDSIQETLGVGSMQLRAVVLQIVR